MPSQVTISTESWEARKCEIQDLYVTQDLPLLRVISIMSSHGFQASRPQYARQFKKWHFFKNRKSHEWKSIGKVLASRARQGKTSTVTIDDQEIPFEKVRRETSRYHLPSLMPRSPTPDLAGPIRICTPTNPLNGALNTSILESASEHGQLIGLRIIQSHRPLTSIVLDNIPSLMFMDSLDLEVQKHNDALLRRSQSLGPGFIDDVKDVLKCCDISLQVIGYTSSTLNLVSEPNNTPPLCWQRLHEMSSIIPSLPKTEALPAFLKLLKIIVSLSANNYLRDSRDGTFQDLIELLQSVDPLHYFVELVVKYELYWIIEKMVNMHTAVTDIFAGNALLYAINLGFSKLVNLLLDSECPLDVTLQPLDDPDYCYREFTALGLAVFQRDEGLVRRLIAAGASAYDGGTDSDDSSLSILLEGWDRFAVSDSRMAILQCLLDAQIATFHPRWLNHWEEAVQKSLNLDEICFCKSILKHLVRLIPEDAHELCMTLIAAAMATDISLLETALAQTQLYSDDLQQNPIYRTIFRGMLGMLIMSPSDQMLKLFIDQGPHLSLNFKSDFHWALWHTLNAKDDRVLYLWQNCSDYFDTSSKQKLLERALICHEVGVIRDLINHMIQRPHEWDECPFCDLDCQEYWLEDSELFELVLEKHMFTGCEDAALCFFEGLRIARDPAVFFRGVNYWESKRTTSARIACISAHAILNSPRFLLAVLKTKDSKFFTALIHFGIQFDGLNQKLSGNIKEYGSKESWGVFVHPPVVLRLALDRGLLPCKTLVIMCALNCRSEYCVENLRIIVEAGLNRGTPFSQEDLSYCLNKITEVFHLEACTCSENSWHVPALRMLVEFGAIAREPWLQDLLKDGSGSYDSFILTLSRADSRPICNAIESGHPNLLEKFLEKGFLQDEPFAWTELGSLTSLGFAVYRRNRDAMHMLIRYGANINESDPCDGITALQVAAAFGDLSMVLELLQLGADINAPASRHRGTALQEAAANRDLSMTLELLRLGADVNAPAHTCRGKTALQAAATNGNLSVALELLRAGADINAPAANEYGTTALEAAAEEGHLDMVQLFINNNSDLAKLRQDCKRASRRAKKHRHSVIARLIEKHARKLAEKLGVEHEDSIGDLVPYQY